MSKFKEWLEWNLGLPSIWSVKKAISGIIFLSLITIVLINLLAPDNSRDKKVDKFSGNTTGTVYKITPKQIMSQTSTGNELMTIGYLVKYKYTVNGITYDQQEYILNKNSNYNLIQFIYSKIGKKETIIKYKLTNPEKSIIYYPSHK